MNKQTCASVHKTSKAFEDTEYVRQNGNSLRRLPLLAIVEKADTQDQNTSLLTRSWLGSCIIVKGWGTLGAEMAEMPLSNHVNKKKWVFQMWFLSRYTWIPSQMKGAGKLRMYTHLELVEDASNCSSRSSIMFLLLKSWANIWKNNSQLVQMMPLGKRPREM